MLSRVSGESISLSKFNLDNHTSRENVARTLSDDAISTDFKNV
jgi:hypothetical protein